MESRLPTPESVGMQFPPSPESPPEPAPKTTKTKAPAKAPKAAKEAAGKMTGPTALAFFIACSPNGDVDWDRAAVVAGYKNGRSAQSAFSPARKKFLDWINTDFPANGGDVGDLASADAPSAKKRKAVKADNGDENENGGKKKRATKKVAKVEVNNDDESD